MATVFERYEYHDVMPEWRDEFDRNGVFHGIELELESDSGDYEEIIASMPRHDEEHDGFAPVLEEDGSLSGHGGVEIVFPPVRPAELRDDNSYIARVINAMGGVACSNSQTGMHFNVNTRNWSKKKLGVFLGLINSMPKAALKNIGGRALNHYCKQWDGDEKYDRWAGRHYKTNPTTVGDYVEMEEDGHYAASRREGRVECRFPKATTNLEKVREVSAFLEYAETYAESGVPASTRLTSKIEPITDAFPDWMRNHPDKAARDIVEKMYAAIPSRNQAAAAAK